MKLNLIDKPGLKGTDKNDETNMVDLLQILAKVGSVNCVLLFNKESNYGSKFEENPILLSRYAWFNCTGISSIRQTIC